MFQFIYSQTCGAHGHFNHSVDPVWSGIGIGRNMEIESHPIAADEGKLKFKWHFHRLLLHYCFSRRTTTRNTYVPMTILFLARSQSRKAASNIRWHRVKYVNWLAINEVNWFGCLAQWGMRWDSISPRVWKSFACSVSARLGAMPTRID